jgi:hypothetical protein
MTNQERAQKLSQAIEEVGWDWGNMEPSHPHTIAVAALREIINQLQQSPGVIMCADVLELCDELEKL